MKKILFIAVLFSVSLSAQTKVIRKSAVKSNDYGVTYFLPKTDLVVTAEISKITTQAGQYNKYAAKYLGFNDPVQENQTYYVLDKLTVATKGVPDENKSYLVVFKTKTTAPFVYLTEEGLICAINAEYEDTVLASSSRPEKKEDTRPKFDIHSVLTEEYFQAGSVGKMAEVIARQIYRLRESRTDLLTGETENVPKDGAAMKLVLEQIELQEKALVEEFTGSKTVEKQTYEIVVNPFDEMDKHVLFRFSKRLGVVKPDDLSGVPVYMNLRKLKNPEQQPEFTDSKESAKELAKIANAKANQQGVIYNLPAKASVEIVFDAKTFYSGEHFIAQFGKTECLLPEVFEDKKAPVKVYFYPETGSLKQVIQ
jgi:hypothetical protein